MLMDTEIIKYVGLQLYQTQYLKELKRYWVFQVRCRTHEREIQDLLDFFAATPLRQKMLRGTPSFLEQVTRSFFYKGSVFQDRVSLVKNHLLILENYFKPELLEELYVKNKPVVLWQEDYEGQSLRMELYFHGGQRKEGCLSLMLYLGEEALYQIMFWLGPEPDGKPALWIGALQGPQNGGEIIKALTKAFFGYRTKNLIFYGLRSLGHVLGLEHIYAVTNAGYYAMNHIRTDRKLKTDFGAFWEECEGVPYAKDERFYVMPVEEHRKDMSELKPSKRAQHRRRFEKLDELDAVFAKNLQSWLK